MIRTANTILKISLGIKGSRPACIAFSKPIIEPKYNIPHPKITTEAIKRDNKLLK